MLRRERLDAHGEERLALPELGTLELEGRDAGRDHRPELRRRESEAGLLEDFSHRPVLDGFAVVEAATRREPPRPGLGPTGIEPVLEQDAPAGDQDNAGRRPFLEHASDATGGSGGSREA